MIELTADEQAISCVVPKAIYDTDQANEAWFQALEKRGCISRQVEGDPV